MSQLPHAIGEYMLERRVGVGWHAEVFAARDATGRPWAIKRFHPGLARAYGRELLVELHAELERMPRPCAPEWLDIDQIGWAPETSVDGTRIEESVLYASMSLASGGDLSEAQSPYPWPAPAVAQLLWSALRALAALQEGRPGAVFGQLHERHVMIDAQGGISLSPLCATSFLHRPGNRYCRGPLAVYRGDYEHWSPEQVGGGDVDARSDLFSAGLLAYKLLTGRHPFERSNQLATLHALLRGDEIAVPAIAEDAVPGLQTTLRAILARTPSERPDGARAALALGLQPSDEGRLQLAACARPS